LLQLAKPAFGCAAVVNSDGAVFQENCILSFYDCCAAERRLRQLLQGFEQDFGAKKSP
jgi:hypothetical protein